MQARATATSQPCEPPRRRWTAASCSIHASTLCEALERLPLDNTAVARFAITLPNFLSVLTTLLKFDALFTVSRWAGQQVAQLLGAHVLEISISIERRLVFARRQAERGAKPPAKVGEIIEPIVHGDLADISRRQQRISQVAPHAFQAPAPNTIANRFPLRAEQ